jgi:hypothetical protein
MPMESVILKGLQRRKKILKKMGKNKKKDLTKKEEVGTIGIVFLIGQIFL